MSELKQFSPIFLRVKYGDMHIWVFLKEGMHNSNTCGARQNVFVEKEWNWQFWDQILIFFHFWLLWRFCFRATYGVHDEIDGRWHLLSISGQAF